MAFQPKWSGKRKREQSNRLREKPTISFRSNLYSRTLGHLKKLSTTKKRTEFINKAIEMKFFSITDKKQFLTQVMEENYDLCRYLLRRIGNRK